MTQLTDEDVITRRWPPKLRVKAHYMRQVSSAGDRQKVTREYKRMLTEKGISTGPMNDERRECLAEAIFLIENDIEHRSDGFHNEKTRKRIDELNHVRNILYTDLRWNEPSELEVA